MHILLWDTQAHKIQEPFRWSPLSFDSNELASSSSCLAFRVNNDSLLLVNHCLFAFVVHTNGEQQSWSGWWLTYIGAVGRDLQAGCWCWQVLRLTDALPLRPAARRLSSVCLRRLPRQREQVPHVRRLCVDVQTGPTDCTGQRRRRRYS